MLTPRVAAIHDISGYGRCSLTVALPILSAMGMQCCPLPTAFLSTHTGECKDFTFLDITDEMPKIANHWLSLNLDFQAIYSGFLGSEQQIKIVSDFIRDFRREDTIVVVDPVMGDHGVVYQTYTPEMCEGTRLLAEQADVITPNLTEAALLLGVPYQSLTNGEAGCREIVERLSRNGRRSVVLTGASSSPEMTGAAFFDAVSGQIGWVQTQRINREFFGTGDIFTSVLTGALMQKLPLAEAVQSSVDFVHACAERTARQELPMREGVDFEPLLHMLIK